MIDWKELNESEIETKLKTLEFEYNGIVNKINELYSELSSLNNDYIKGKKEIETRLKNK